MKMIKKIFLATLFLFPLFCSYAQVGIGTENPNPSAILDIESNGKGVLIPRMTESERNLISPAVGSEGLLVYQTDGDEGMWYYDGTDWNKVDSEIISGHWEVSGDDIYNGNAGNVGIGTGSTTTAPLHIKGITELPTAGGEVILYENDFSAVDDDDLVTEVGPTNTCSGTENVWHVQELAPQGTNMTAPYAEIWNSAASSCIQDEELIEGTFSPLTNQITVNFKYHFENMNGTGEFSVTLYNESTSPPSLQEELIAPTSSSTYGVNFSQPVAVTSGNSYSLRFNFVGANNEMGVELDDILVTEDDPTNSGTYVFKLEDGTQGAGKVLTTDANGNAFWANPPAASPIAPLQKTGAGTSATIAQNLWIEDFGTSKLANGEVHVDLNEAFKKKIDLSAKDSILVFLQEEGESNELFFEMDADGEGFTVREKNRGSSNINFTYTITAKKKMLKDDSKEKNLPEAIKSRKEHHH